MLLAKRQRGGLSPPERHHGIAIRQCSSMHFLLSTSCCGCMCVSADKNIARIYPDVKDCLLIHSRKEVILRNDVLCVS